jgi:hypothetical protein
MKTDVMVHYSTECHLPGNHGQPGTGYERSFGSPEAAMEAPLPSGFTKAFIFVEDGRHVYSTRFGWELYEKS